MNRESERKRLVELIRAIGENATITCPRYIEGCGLDTCNGCQYDMEDGSCNYAERESDHLLDNGIGIKPPIELCKRKGDYIFVIDNGEITEGLLCLVHYNSEGEDEIIVSDEWDNKLLFYKFADYGKTVFLTREEAEKALKEGVE